jgi:hypothetical protein
MCEPSSSISDCVLYVLLLLLRILSLVIIQFPPQTPPPQHQQQQQQTRFIVGAMLARRQTLKWPPSCEFTAAGAKKEASMERRKEGRKAQRLLHPSIHQGCQMSVMIECMNDLHFSLLLQF